MLNRLSDRSDLIPKHFARSAACLWSALAHSGLSYTPITRPRRSIEAAVAFPRTNTSSPPFPNETALQVLTSTPVRRPNAGLAADLQALPSLVLNAPVRAKPIRLVRHPLASDRGSTWPPFAATIAQIWPTSIANISNSPFRLKSTSTAETMSGPFLDIIFSEDQPAELPERLSKLSAWTLTSSRMGITRHFTFPTFAAAWRFMSQVADECKAKRHHPEWSNLYNKVTVEWTTHRPEGLSIRDVEMAEFCDRVADEIGLKEDQ